ncbi:Pentatricopeptide repeat-containing protein, mitochondrial [Capsicum chinense]|nr:Pentatricopeptide repeat-containing protein, mitochondrial [Capsicum chinense]
MRLWWVMFRWFHTPWVMPRTMKDLMRRGSVGKQREKAEKTKHLKHGFDSINVVRGRAIPQVSIVCSLTLHFRQRLFPRLELSWFLVLFNDKVKVIFFSQTGERATPFIRQAAKNYSAVATFAFVLWQEGESSLWLGVESAPAIVFLKETGYVNSSLFVDIMEKNKHQVLPQLRSVTSKELGCDARGFSRAGKDTKIWYCVVLVGRVQETLSKDGELTAVDQDLSSAPALLALKQKRLTFTWLDGEAQKSYCFFYINSEDSYETCGPRDMIDTAQLFIVRYDRNGTEDVGKQPTNKFSALYNVESDPASQLVAKYNGSNKIEEIVQWISEIIKDGDSKDLPSFKSRTPELVPEDADSSWSSWTQGTVSPSGGLNHRVKSLLNKIHDYSDDPRVGPFLLLAALISFGSVWFKRSQVAQSSKPNHSSQKSKEREHLEHQTSEPDQSNQPNTKDVTMRKRRTRPRNDLVPPSMTDVDPKDAYQVEFSDSDTGRMDDQQPPPLHNWVALQAVLPCRHVATQVFNKEKWRLELNCKLYTILIYGWCKVKDIAMARRFLGEMLDKGILPNVVRSNVLLNGICRRASLHPVGRFDKVIRDAEKVFEEMTQSGAEPDVTSYSIRLHVYSRAHKPELSLEKSRIMRDKRDMPEYCDIYLGHQVPLLLW